jgi:hypothetical protein
MPGDWSKVRGVSTKWRVYDFYKVGFIHPPLEYSLIMSADIYRAEPTRRRECLYYLALGYYKMGNYDEAKKFNGTPDSCSVVIISISHIPYQRTALLIEKEPTNLQAKSLADLIDAAVTRGPPNLSPRIYIPSCRANSVQRVTLAWPWRGELLRLGQY